jgi:hypothetical protein
MTTKYIRTFIPVLGLAFAASACTTKDNSRDTLAVDTALNRDLALANRDSAAQPQLNDVPSGTSTTRTGTSSGSTAPRTSTTTSSTRSTTTSTPKSTTPTTTSSGNKVTTGSTGAGGAVGTLPSGTTLNITSNARVCTNTNKVGDTFTGTLSSAVSSGGVTIPAGSQVRLEVVSLKRSENSNDPIQMTFRVQSVVVNGRSYPIEGTVATSAIERVRNESRGKDVQKVATGAVLGAIAGQVLGKNTKGTVIGAAAGAAAGTAAAAATANYEGCLTNGGAMTVTTSSAAQIRVS